MRGRYVEYEGKLVFVFCDLKTPWDEIMRRAAKQGEE